jgi:hypothetical protein
MNNTWYICYDGTEDADAIEAKAEAEAKVKAEAEAEAARLAALTGDINFNDEQQAYVNKLIAEEKRKQQEKTKTVLAELEAMKKKSNLTQKEKEEYENKLAEYRKSVMTKEELAKEEANKLINGYEERIVTSDKEIEKWKSLYHKTTIIRAINDAAAVNKAFNPEQIVAMLQPATQLIEATDEEGKPTGELVPEVDFMTTDQEKKPITLKLSIEKAVEKMKDDERFQNLFLVDGTGGVGGMNMPGKGGAGDADIVALAKDPEKYMKARTEGKLDKQLGPFNKD